MDKHADKVRKGIPTKGVRKSAKCLVGVRLPDFDIKTVSSTFNIKELKGKKSIICFWESNCPPCMYSIPLYKNVKEKLGDDEFNFVAIGLDNEEDILEIAEKFEWDFTHALNGDELITKVFQLNFGYPLTIFVNEELVITDIFPGVSREKIKSGIALSSILEIVNQYD
jgi:thiol-disulfide isomerase/thioredoxin